MKQWPAEKRPDVLFLAGLTEAERALVRNRDWRGMIHYGVVFFMLEKLGAVVGTSNLHIYAAMRGQSLEEFQKTRNAQVLYSVAGQDEGKTNWDKPKALSGTIDAVDGAVETAVSP